MTQFHNYFAICILVAFTLISAASTSTTSTLTTSFSLYLQQHQQKTSAHFNCNLNGNESAFTLLTDNRISMEDGIDEILLKDQTRRYSLLIHNTSPLTINSSSLCHSSKLTWNIFYNKTINFANTENPLITLKCLPVGRYDFFVTPSLATCRWRVTFTHSQHNFNWPFLNLTNPSKIKLQNRPQRRQVLIKWEKSKLDIHAINYCMSINTIQPQSSLCEAAMNSSNGVQKAHEICENFYKVELLQNRRVERIRKIDMKNVSVYCTGFKSQQILRGLQMSTRYYIDVFAVHTKLNNFTYLFGSSQIWFNRTHPVPLTEDKTTVGRLSDLGGVSVFSFKIPKKSVTNSAHVHISLVPCGGSIDLRIMKQKKKIILKRNLYKPTVMSIDEATPGSRYIIRVTPASEDDAIRVNKVEITYTTKEQFKMIPVLPKNTTVFEFVSMRNCRSTTIAWYSSTDSRKVRYCVYVLRMSMKNRDYDYLRPVNFCEINTKLTNHQDFQQMYCFYPEKRNTMETLRIVDLSPGRQYYVHLTGSLTHGKNLPYDSVRIKTTTKCKHSLGGGSGTSLNSRRQQHFNNGTRFISDNSKSFLST